MYLIIISKIAINYNYPKLYVILPINTSFVPEGIWNYNFFDFFVW